MTVLIVLTLSLMMMFVVYFVYKFSDSVAEQDSKRTLSAIINEQIGYISTKDGILTIKKGFEYEKDKIYFLILDENGVVLEGQYPEGFSEVPVIEPFTTRKLMIDGKQYFVRDVRKRGRIDGSRIYLRGVVRTKDVFSHYKTIVNISYIVIVSVYAVAIFIVVCFAKGISKSLYQMKQTAETIGRNCDVTQRMEYKGRYQELKVLVQANNRMLDRIEQHIRQQEQFTSDVAHELRTPISVILAQCEYAKEYAKEYPDNSGEQEAAIENIYRQSQKVNRIITQLLYLSRIEQGRMQLQAEAVDLLEIVESVCEDEQEKAQNAVCVQKHLSPAETVVDINLIAIAIQNLIINAIKFSKKDGIIEVSCGQQGEEAFVAVKDYGKGMDKEELEHIFERFYKTDKSRNSEGFGLGLSITKKIVEINHGTIEVESTLGKGSEFILKFPLNRLGGGVRRQLTRC